MQEYLIDKAIDQIWCNPRQDNPNIIEPARVTPASGAISQAFVLGRWIDLPWGNKRAHVFQVGQYPPALLGLLERNPSWLKEKWISFKDAINELPLSMNIYNEYGVSIPRFNSYFMWTKEKCLIFAIKRDNRVPVDLGKDRIYFRFYTSAYLQSLGTPTPEGSIMIKGYESVGADQIVPIQTEYLANASKPGFTEAFINGQYVSELSIRTVQQGDIVEWIYDSTVKRTVNWTIRDLKPFTSLMDKKTKYILHYSKDVPVNVIDYQDDVDVYILTNGKYDTKIGRYFFKNLPDAMRNLTHRDYSINSDYVMFIAEYLAEYLEMEVPELLDFQIFIKIKESGYNRPLIKDANKIQELYKLEDYRIMMAMSGVETLVPMWHAPNLEESAYTNIMGSALRDIDIVKAQNAYGYNTVSKMIGNTPNKVRMIGTQGVAPLSYLDAMGSTVYEYNVNGKMLGHYWHGSLDDDYDTRFMETKWIEAIVGKLSDRSSNYFGTNNITIPDNCSFRLYRCRLDFNHNPPIPMYDWKDITDTNDYKVEDNKIVWTSVETDQFLCLRTDESILGYDLEIKQNLGNVLFALYEYVDKGNGLQKYNLDIPYGSIQIYLNGYNLVQDIDYVINFPYVCINNQKFFNQPAQTSIQNIHIRMTGFCGADLKVVKPTETGFIRNGLISNNGVYKDFMDKVTHISVGGAFKSQTEVKFWENKPGWFPRDPTNGQPYQIDRIIVPMRGFTQSDTYTLLDIADNTDNLVDSYMNMYWSRPTDEPLSSSEVRWRLTSPFFSCLVELCTSNSVWWPDYQVLSDIEVQSVCKPYESLLNYDPLVEENSVPSLYVNITPTRFAQPVNISRAQYRFLESAVRIYGRGKIGLNNFLTFTVQQERP